MPDTTIYFDIETTGLRPDQDRIVEIAAYCSETKEHFTQLVNPEVGIPEEASRVHGISDEMVQTAAKFGEIGQNFCEFCLRDDAQPVLIAHNGDGFDQLFLRAEFKRANLPHPSWRTLDSLKWARKYRPDLPRHSLQYLRQVYQVAENNAHRALDDVMVLYQIFSQMIDDLPIGQILEILRKDPVIAAKLQAMPFGKHQGVAFEKVPKNYLRWLKSSGALEKGENSALKARLIELNLLS